MRFRSTPAVVAALLICLIPTASSAQLASYTQDFENLIQTDIAALANDGWFVWGNVFGPDGTTYLYGYGSTAPNDGAAFCQIDINQGGVDQGFQQLVAFSDYLNTDHAVGNLIESNTYREQVVGAEDVDRRWVFSFEAKLGNIEGASTAAAFIKTLDPNAGYALTNFKSLDMTSTPVTWTGYEITIDIDASLVGQLLQIGFMNTASNYEGAGIFYDNISFHDGGPVTAAPPSSSVKGMTLSQNYPNPFNPSTQIDFRLEQPGNVEITVYDVAGRRVATLQQGAMDSGAHTVSWNGRTDAGAPVASGQYRYVMRTDQGQLSRGMTLLK